MGRSALLLLVGVLTILTIGLGGTSSQSQKVEGLKAIAFPPPSSLDSLYPPKAEQPIYLFRMLGLDTFFLGIVADLFENDLQHAKANFKKFKAQYVEVSKLVPQWEKNFPMGPVNDLGAALETGDRGKVMAAHDKVGKVCHDCHVANMPQVEQKYRWGDFYAIRVKDPLTNEEVDFPQLKKYLAANFAGISVDTEQGQRENAQKQFQGFNARFQTLKETCGNCHGTERKYYVDESVQGLLDKLGQALRGSSVDQNVVGRLTQGIGMESCLKCHLVHIPAAFAKFQWEK
jgi:cytochrome c556